jgi:hypothetical protein
MFLIENNYLGVLVLRIEMRINIIKKTKNFLFFANALSFLIMRFIIVLFLRFLSKKIYERESIL